MTESSPENESLASALVTDEQAKALASVGNFGTTVVTETSNLARYIGRIVGTVPEDAVGLIIGDPLHAIRSLAAEWYDLKVKEIHERRKVKHLQPVSLSVALPLIHGAYDESREELRDLWAALIASAMDPERADRVRISFIETLKKFDPLDAKVLKRRSQLSDEDRHRQPRLTAIEIMMQSLDVSRDEIVISVENLMNLRCVAIPGVMDNFAVTAYGRGLIKAIED
jgi:hypothetical protein